MKKRLIALVGVAVLGGVAFVRPAQASLSTFKSYSGTVGLSTDGCGSTTNLCTINAFVPAGSTVVSAFLYSAYFESSGTDLFTSGALTLNGTAVNFTQNNPNSTACCSIGSLRADVTSIVAPVVNAGGGAATTDAATGQAVDKYGFAVNEGSDARIDGEALVVVYTNASLPIGSVGILDGFSAVGGDTASINFVDPLDPSSPGFFAEMRIADGFSCCGQESTIKVNGTTITDTAGNDDDGGEKVDHFISNGNLITAGGNDDPFSALLPAYADDHERYNLLAEITKGDTKITVDTNNPSANDDIFMEAFLVSGNAGFNQPPPSTVPEPTTIFLVGSGLLLVTISLRRKNA